jgi:hypothetical protein
MAEPIQSPAKCELRYVRISNSHLVGLWIGATISNTSQLKKPVIQLPNEHGSRVKGHGRRQCCHTNHIKRFPIDQHVMYLYFPDTG